jgi:DNA-binding NarL/FixJ family response regulator
LNNIKVYLIDDHQVLIDGLKMFLQSEEHIQIVGTNTNASIALDEIKELQPDVVLTDISMPVMNGIDFTAAYCKHNKEAKILALSMFTDAKNIMQIMTAGALGYVQKSLGKQELIEAINAIALGKNYFSKEIQDIIIGATDADMETEIEKSVLSTREIEVVQLIAKELNNAQIADELFISERTVETHRKNIMRKTNSHSAIGLIKFAMNANLL